MYQEKRPTCVTVIGWVWIILGGLMFLSSIMALFGSITINQASQTDPEALKNIPAIYKYFSFRGDKVKNAIIEAAEGQVCSGNS